MADDGFAYAFGLEDQLSGPARAEGAALKALEGQVEKTEKALRQLRREQLLNKELGIKDKGLAIKSAHLGLDLSEMRSQLRSLKPPAELKETQGLLSSFGEHLTKGAGGSFLLAGGLAAVGAGAAIAVEKIAELGIESVKFAVEAAEFKHNTEIAYTAVKGTAEEGEATFREIDKMARAVHLPAEQAHGLARDLMLQGLEDTKAIGGVIAADAALIRTGQVEGAAKLKMIVERSLASGHFDPGKMGGGKGGGEASGRALAGLGVHLPELIEDIARRTNKSVGEVKLALQHGKIDTEVGIAALTDAIGGSPIGKAAKEKFDFGDFTTDIKNLWRGVVQDVDLKPLEQAFRDVAYAMGEVSDNKAGIVGAFDEIISSMSHVITDATIMALTIENEFLEVELAVKPVTDAIDSIDNALSRISGHGIGGTIAKALSSANPATAAAFSMFEESPGNAEGGRVMEPAPGEMFASVAPGEFIVPADGMPQGSGGGGHQITVDVGGLHFSGPVDHTNVIPLLESQLADVFERVALEMGR